MIITFWDFLMFDQIFLSLRVKPSEIISSHHGIHDLPLKLLNDLRSLKITNYQENHKTSYNYSLVSSSYNENFVNTSKKLLKNRTWTFPVVPYLTWELEFVSNILCIIVDLSQVNTLYRTSGKCLCTLFGRGTKTGMLLNI